MVCLEGEENNFIDISVFLENKEGDYLVQKRDSLLFLFLKTKLGVNHGSLTKVEGKHQKDYLSLAYWLLFKVELDGVYLALVIN